MNPWTVKAVNRERKTRVNPEPPEGNLCLPTRRALRKLLWATGRRLRDYFGGAHWRQVIQDYRDCGLPMICRECGQGPVILRHLTLERLDRELLDDLIPLCGACNKAAHAWERWAPQTSESDSPLPPGAPA